MMRYVLCLLCFAILQTAKAEDPFISPTPEQLYAAQKTYFQLGATYCSWTCKTRNLKIHEFKLPGETTDSDLQKLVDLPFHFALSISHTFKLSDNGLQALAKLDHLIELNVEDNSKITDKGMRYLKSLKMLTSLNISGTAVTDKGLKELGEMPQLMILNLFGTKITDEGVAELKSLKRLVVLSLIATQVTDRAIKDLQQALPKCTIWDGRD